MQLRGPHGIRVSGAMLNPKLRPVSKLIRVSTVMGYLILPYLRYAGIDRILKTLQAGNPHAVDHRAAAPR
jgi:hypothetical protein